MTSQVRSVATLKDQYIRDARGKIIGDQKLREFEK
jgi:hypothetical protein